VEIIDTAEFKKLSRIQKAEYFFYRMLLIRRFEEEVLSLFSKDLIYGTTHAYIGQEADALGVLANISKNDVVFSSHRCHGHYLTYTDDVEGLLCELMGRKNGVCGGRGGSQHLCRGNFYSNGVQGGIVPCATGMAYAEKIKNSGSIIIVYIGDGTLGQGVLYESMNIASLWQVPILFVLENNEYAQSTYYKDAVAGSMLARAQAFGIEATQIATTDVFQVYEIAEYAVNYVRKNIHPFFLQIDTYRFCPHSKSDDYRSVEEIEKRKELDPLKLCGKLLDAAERTALDTDVSNRISKAVEYATKQDLSIMI